MDAGVTLVAPETVFLAADTKFGRDVTVEPYVVFGSGVTVEDNAVIRSFSHLDHGPCRQGLTGRALCAAAARRETRRATCTSAISSRSRKR
jgi:bifunctional N-acetylglucosamine-1-phosphate-uridyltransferase/glucosamine-1-phosphate-acetyltransferase GlmU-like protein